MALPIEAEIEAPVELQHAGAMAPVVATGNLLVKFRSETSSARAAKLLREATTAPVAAHRDFSTSYNLQDVLAGAGAVYLNRFNVGVLRCEPDTCTALQARLDNASDVELVIPEFYLFSYQGTYSAGNSTDEDEDTHADSEGVTWGIKAIRAEECDLTGAGIKVGILDTGFDMSHPDFRGREIITWSGVGEPADVDLQGHGTHCAGTAAGPDAADDRMRYGVAPRAQLRIYKVLNNGGFGTDGSALSGIHQALDDGCEVISMSFGRGAKEYAKPHPIFEDVGKRALDGGSLIIAAAGNASSRDLGYVAPIDYPANSPSIVAVAALDSRLRVANYSAGTATGGTSIDFAAPGSGVFSSAPMPRRYRRWRGTSMAAPHVAGAACLWAESDKDRRGRDLWKMMAHSARRLPLQRRDVGVGLIQAP